MWRSPNTPTVNSSEDILNDELAMRFLTIPKGAAAIKATVVMGVKSKILTIMLGERFILLAKIRASWLMAGNCDGWKNDSKSAFAGKQRKEKDSKGLAELKA